MEGNVLELRLRPKVPMGFYQAIPVVCSLGLADAVPGASVAWPHGVVFASGEEAATLRASGGYDDQGMYADVVAELAADISAEAARAGITARVDAWAAAIAAGRGAAGPLAPVLDDLFGHTWLMGGDVVVTYPNGRPIMRATFCGLDVWGRATVRDTSGREVEFAPEQARIVAAQ